MIVNYSDLSKLREGCSNSKIVLVGGCYDLLHVGHVAYLEQCRALGDILVVAASADDRIRQRKGSLRPVISQSDRVRMLASLKCVDYAVAAPTLTTASNKIPTVMVINELLPNIFATSDERFEEYSESLLQQGINTVFVPEIRLTSTTAIIKRIQSAK
jgi:rfaE bifunctional protein nucleotidyltransferase chain/domain